MLTTSLRCLDLMKVMYLPSIAGSSYAWNNKVGSWHFSLLLLWQIERFSFFFIFQVLMDLWAYPGGPRFSILLFSSCKSKFSLNQLERQHFCGNFRKHCFNHKPSFFPYQCQNDTWLIQHAAHGQTTYYSLPAAKCILKP